MPFLRITDPSTGAAWAIWFMKAGGAYILPRLCEKLGNGVLWQIDELSTFELRVLGHRVNKIIKLERRPSWNKLVFRFARGGGDLLPAKESTPLLAAFRKGRVLPLFWFAPPSCWDSADRRGEIIYNIVPIRSGVWELEVTLDPQWLDEAVYPVYIDPSLVLQPASAEGKDNYIYNTTRTSNRGVAPDIRIVKESAALLRTLIQFDLSAIPPGANIISSVLHLYLNRGWYPMIEVHANRIIAHWEEGGCNGSTCYEASCWDYRSYDTLPWGEPGAGAVGVDIAEFTEVTDCGGTISDIDVDLTESTQQIVNGAPNYGWRLRCSENVYTEGSSFCSSDYSEPNLHPMLTVEYEQPTTVIPVGPGAIAGRGTVEPLAKGG